MNSARLDSAVQSAPIKRKPASSGKSWAGRELAFFCRRQAAQVLQQDRQNPLGRPIPAW